MVMAKTLLLAVVATLATTTTTALQQAKRSGKAEFKNPVPVLQEIIDKGFNDPSREGSYRIKFGVLTEKVDPRSVPTKKEQQKRRAQAAETLTNIDQDERDRRQVVGSICAVLSVLLGVGLPAVGVSLPFRFAIELFPVFLAMGYLLSAKEGLWNIAQGGYFDVAGVGIEKIEDPGLAQALLDKVTQFNKEVAYQAVALTAVIALGPELVSRFL